MVRPAKMGCKAWAVVGILALASSLAAAAPEVREAFPQVELGGIDPVEYFSQQLELQSRLLAEMPAGTLEDGIRVTVSAQDLKSVEDEARNEPGRGVVGLTKQVGRVIDLSSLDGLGSQGGRISGGSAHGTGDGGFVWATSIVAEGASALRIHLGGLQLPQGSELYVYSLEGQAFGPFRQGDDAGDLWAPTIMGSTAIVQVRHSGPVLPDDRSRLRFRVEEVGHIGSSFLPARWASRQEAFCNYNVSCIQNAGLLTDDRGCGNGPSWPRKADAQNASAMMLWVSGAFLYTCSGGLVAQSAPATPQIPYFLTANHCLSRDKDAQNLETYFQYRVGCGSACPSEWTGGGIQRNGASVIASNRTGDFTLLRLNQAPPSGSVFMGWTSAAVSGSNGTALYRISHPATAPEAYSTQNVSTSAPTCSGWPRGSWIYSKDTHGGTEGGSSGSNVYNAAGQVVGQLSGGCGTNVNNACDAVNNATVDGAFASYFSQVAPYLDNGGGCVPSSEVCDDGSDNDCDGAIDCSDSDCSGDPACGGGGCANPGGAPAGASCVDNAECCSNNCKGKPGSKTCK